MGVPSVISPFYLIASSDRDLSGIQNFVLPVSGRALGESLPDGLSFDGVAAEQCADTSVHEERVSCLLMTEQQKYDVVSEYDGWEVRCYPAHLVAEVNVRGSFDDAVNRAFRMLAAFIFGDNIGKEKVAMTAPVVQEPLSEKIAMTAPVVHESKGQEHVVAFVMPAQYTLETLPEPTDNNIRIREVPEEMAAVRQFSGRSTETQFAGQLGGLLSRVEELQTWKVNGTPRYARFDPPWKPWFLRRNEVIVPVVTTTG